MTGNRWWKIDIRGGGRGTAGRWQIDVYDSAWLLALRHIVAFRPGVERQLHFSPCYTPLLVVAFMIARFCTLHGVHCASSDCPPIDQSCYC